MSCCSPVTQCLGASRRRALSEREEQVPVVPKPGPSFPVTPDTGAADSNSALELRPVFAGRLLVYSTFTISPGTGFPAKARVIQGQLTPGLSGDGLGACRQPRARAAIVLAGHERRGQSSRFLQAAYPIKWESSRNPRGTSVLSSCPTHRLILVQPQDPGQARGTRRLRPTCHELG